MALIRDILHKRGYYHKSEIRRKAFREYAAAAINRLTADWTTISVAIDQDIRGGIVPVRERARNMAKNNDLVRRFLNLCKVNIVGPFGFTLQMNVNERIEINEPSDGGKQTTTYKIVQDTLANMKIEEAWADWCKPENCDASGRLSFRQICALIVEGKKRDGEAFLRIVPRKDSKHGILLQVIPPESIDEKYFAVLRNGNMVKMGVELDAWRRPVAYYVKKTNRDLELYGLSGFTGDYDRLPAWQVIHYFRQDFANQTRGMSEMVQSMLRLQMMQKWEESSAVNARTSAAKMPFLEQAADNSEEYKGTDEDEEGNIIASVEPGQVELLPPGIKLASWSPEFPHAQHEPFIKSMSKAASAGLNVAYASLSNDLSEANYGSNRVGLLDERAMWMMEQEDFIAVVLNRVFPEWLLSALGKTIALPPEKYDKFNKPTWAGRRWPWIDPLKDMAATALELKLMLTSHYDVIGQMGKDPEQILQDMASFKELVEKYGFTFNMDNLTIPSLPKDAQQINGKGIEISDAEEAAVFDFVKSLLAQKWNGKRQETHHAA